MDPKPGDLPLDSMSETFEQLEEELIGGDPVDDEFLEDLEDSDVDLENEALGKLGL